MLSRMLYGSLGLRRLDRGQWRPPFLQRSTRFLPAPPCITSRTSRCIVPRRKWLIWLHPRLLRHGRVFHHKYGRVWHRLVLSALRRQLLVRSALYLWGRSGLYVEFGNGLEHHDRCRLLLRLSLLLLSVVGAMGLLRALLLGSGLGLRLRRIRQRKRIRPLGQYCLRQYRTPRGRIRTLGTMAAQTEPRSRTRSAVR